MMASPSHSAEDSSTGIQAELDTILAAISRRQKATSALADWCNSDPAWRPACPDEGTGGLEGCVIRVPSQPELVTDCPFRESDTGCWKLQEADSCEAAARSRWLSSAGVGLVYHGASLDLVNEQVRPVIAAYLQDLEQNLYQGKGLLVMGGTGTGKSCILALIAREAYDRRIRDTLWAYSYDLYAALCSHTDRDRERVQRWRQTNLLLLDEFGAAFSGAYPESEFEGLCEHRWANRLVTCVATNLSAKAIQQSPSWSRIYDRWRSTCWGIELTGPSKRTTLAGRL